MPRLELAVSKASCRAPRTKSSDAIIQMPNVLASEITMLTNAWLVSTWVGVSECIACRIDCAAR